MLLAGMAMVSVCARPFAAASMTASRSRMPQAGSRLLRLSSNLALDGAVCPPPRTREIPYQQRVVDARSGVLGKAHDRSY
ncbi:MAG TPA: hypothetical protein QGH84_01320 [Rhodospirillales bacterium]|nr:hypothetical protein [Rhodospirillales bacterium]